MERKAWRVSGVCREAWKVRKLSKMKEGIYGECVNCPGKRNGGLNCLSREEGGTEDRGTHV